MKFIKLNGRLGNNLFQYALYLSLQKDYYFPIFLYGWDSGLQKYFVNFSIFNHAIFIKTINKFISLVPNKYTLKQKDFQPTYEILNLIKEKPILDGYFQSVFFFENCIDEVKKKLKIKKNFCNQFNQRFGHLYRSNKILAIHCRIGDYLDWGNESLGGKNLVLPVQYYKNALSEIKNIQEYRIIVITDDVKNAKQKLNFINDCNFFSESEIIDFQIIMNASAVIIANSTFSWWAAYLNDKAEIKIAPENFVGFKIKKDFPENIYYKTDFKIVKFN